MLYFTFNTEGFVAPKQLVTVTPYKNGKPSAPYDEIQEVMLGDIESYFFKKLHEELGLTEIGTGNALYDVIGIPISAFSIDDEKIANLDALLKFALKQCANIPILELENKSLKDLGISLEFCKKIKNSDLNSRISGYLQENNLEYVQEEILWKNMTTKEKTNVFSSKLLEIGTASNELIIVDPYLFSTKNSEYCDLLAGIIAESRAKVVLVITDKKNYKQESFDCVNNAVGITIKVKYSTEFHDRFWISNRKKAFYTGTSFNGIGKKLSLINLIDDLDVSTIVESLSEQGLI